MFYFEVGFIFCNVLGKIYFKFLLLNFFSISNCLKLFFNFIYIISK